MSDPEVQAAHVCGAAVEAIRGHLGDLGTALAMWGTRDDARAFPEARRAANDAMDAINAALAGLHALRQSLVSEIKASDDANVTRVDELLAKAGRAAHESAG